MCVFVCFVLFFFWGLKSSLYSIFVILELLRFFKLGGAILFMYSLTEMRGICWIEMVLFLFLCEVFGWGKREEN
jgi:hypothetical protein